jgi:hypothetical protein
MRHESGNAWLCRSARIECPRGGTGSFSVSPSNSISNTRMAQGEGDGCVVIFLTAALLRRVTGEIEAF